MEEGLALSSPPADWSHGEGNYARAQDGLARWVQDLHAPQQQQRLSHDERVALKRGLAEEVASYKTRFPQVAPLQTSVNEGRQEDKQSVVPRFAQV